MKENVKHFVVIWKIEEDHLAYFVYLYRRMDSSYHASVGEKPLLLLWMAFLLTHNVQIIDYGMILFIYLFI